MPDAIARATFRAVPKTALPPGKLVNVDEHEGNVFIDWYEDETTQELCAELTYKHRYILGTGQWLQHWESDVSPRDVAPTGENRRIAAARYQIAGPGELLPNELCRPRERLGEFIWLIREGHMSEALIAAMNEYLAHVVGNGLWRQNWDDPNGDQ